MWQRLLVTRARCDTFTMNEVSGQSGLTADMPIFVNVFGATIITGAIHVYLLFL